MSYVLKYLPYRTRIREKTWMKIEGAHLQPRADLGRT